MSDFNGDPDFYNPHNPAFEKDDDTTEIFTCYFCGEKIDEVEDMWLPIKKSKLSGLVMVNEPCCPDCYEYEKDIFKIDETEK